MSTVLNEYMMMRSIVVKLVNAVSMLQQ